MINKKLMAVVCALLIAACPIVMAQDFLDHLEVMYFSEDGRMAAIKTSGDVEAVGGPVTPNAKLLVFDLSSGSQIQSMDYTNFLLSEPGVEKLDEANEKMKQYALESIFIIGIDVEAHPGRLPEDLEVNCEAKPLDKHGEIYRLTFSLRHPGTGRTLNVGESESWLPDASSKAKVTRVYPLPKGNGFLAIYRSPPRMEFDPGKPGLLILSPTVMAEFYNGVGFAYYKQKAYDPALAYFTVSHQYDPFFPKAAFNVACIYALKGDVDGSIEFLDKMMDMPDGAAWKLFQQAHTDSDFNGIRNNTRFKAFMDNARPRLR